MGFILMLVELFFIMILFLTVGPVIGLFGGLVWGVIRSKPTAVNSEIEMTADEFESKYQAWRIKNNHKEAVIIGVDKVEDDLSRYMPKN